MVLAVLFFFKLIVLAVLVVLKPVNLAVLVFFKLVVLAVLVVLKPVDLVHVISSSFFFCFSLVFPYPPKID